MHCVLCCQSNKLSWLDTVIWICSHFFCCHCYYLLRFWMGYLVRFCNWSHFDNMGLLICYMTVMKHSIPYCSVYLFYIYCFISLQQLHKCLVNVTRWTVTLLRQFLASEILLKNFTAYINLYNWGLLPTGT